MIVRKQVLNLVQWHVVGMGWGTESSTDKVAGAVTGNDGLKFWEVFRVQLVVLDEVSCGLGVGIGTEHSDDLLLQPGLVVYHEFGGGDPL